jgi:hypothetical protein
MSTEINPTLPLAFDLAWMGAVVLWLGLVAAPLGVDSPEQQGSSGIRVLVVSARLAHADHRCADLVRRPPAQLRYRSAHEFVARQPQSRQYFLILGVHKAE